MNFLKKKTLNRLDNKGRFIHPTAKVGSNPDLGENCVILPNAVIPDKGKVGKDEIIIATPTSKSLYEGANTYIQTEE